MADENTDNLKHSTFILNITGLCASMSLTRLESQANDSELRCSAAADSVSKSNLNARSSCVLHQS